MKFKIFSDDEGEYKYFVIMCLEEKPYEIIKEIEKKLRTLKKRRGEGTF